MTTSDLLTPTVSPTSLSTEELLARVREVSPKVAVFDCDGTLWGPDSGFGFMKWTMETGLLSRELTDWLEERHRLYRVGEVDEITICGEMVQVYRGIRENELRASAAEFFVKRVEPFIFPEMMALVNELRVGGVEIWAVSSTNNWVVEEGVKRFGIPPERVLGACVEVVGGVATNVLRDVPSDEGKAASLVRVERSRPCAVFGNSIHDYAMLLTATRAFPINPTVALAEKSAELGWPVYYPVGVSS